MCAYKNASSKNKGRKVLADQSFDTFDLYRSPGNQLERVIITSHGSQALTNRLF